MNKNQLARIPLYFIVSTKTKNENAFKFDDVFHYNVEFTSSELGN